MYTSPVTPNAVTVLRVVDWTCLGLIVLYVCFAVIFSKEYVYLGWGFSKRLNNLTYSSVIIKLGKLPYVQAKNHEKKNN